MTRTYDSPVRRRQAEETRERIVTAGAELLHGFAVWNWRALTVRAVAQRSGVNERTVYRYFANERELRDAVLERLERDSGIALDGLQLEDIQDHTRRILEYVSTFPLESRMPLDETLRTAAQRQRDSLQGAVAPATPTWSEADRTVAAGMLDVLWSVASYERLVADWGIESDDAIRGVTWVLGLVEEAIHAGRGPA
jgi:AcrR family transcriptional regulator